MVNTFLPEPSFQRSLTLLDRQRLGKQRVEAKQILQALRGERKGWVNHPATRMWRGYEGSLCLFGILSCVEWMQRGYVDNLLSWFCERAVQYPDKSYPWWFRSEVFHRSHQSNLIRKDQAYYGGIWKGVPSDLPYFWPVPE